MAIFAAWPLDAPRDPTTRVSDPQEPGRYLGPHGEGTTDGSSAMHDEPIPIPPAHSAWPTVSEFALTYNAYARHRGYARVSSMGQRALAAFNEDGTLPRRVNELRAVLFFEQRCWNHAGRVPDPGERVFVDAILTSLHEQTGGTVPGPPDPAYDRGPQVHRHRPLKRWWIHNQLKRKARRISD